MDAKSYQILTKPRLDADECVKIHQNILANVLWENGNGGSTGNDAKEIVPTTAYAAAVTLN